MSGGPAAGMPGPEPVRGAAPIVEAGGPEIAELLERTERRLAAVAASHGPELGRHASRTLSAGGKRLRPVLVFLCGRDGGQERSVAAATAVELLHMATLVHDDVLDRAELRRGRPTVYVTGGREAATATGDFLFSRAFAELAATGSAAAVTELSRASSALARGELVQRADAWSDAVTAERYLERCELKTGRLFEAACRLGALLGPAGAAGAQPLGTYGLGVGVAFQMLDDILDVAEPVERTGKQRGTDLLDGTVTLPLILARDRDPALAALDLRSITTSAGAERVCERIAATGALEECRRRALDHVTAAKRALAGAPVEGGARRGLELLADGVVERYA